MSRTHIAEFGRGTISRIEYTPNLLPVEETFALVQMADPFRLARRWIEERVGIAAGALPCI